MYELIQTGDKSYYINCPAKIGIYLADDNQVYLIDSGNNKDAGKKVFKILEQQSWQLKGILNTHSHADHIGGNRYLQEQTGCKIFSGGMETAFIQYPNLEATFLFGGYPCNDLRHKSLLAQSSQTVDFSDPDFPKEVDILPLPGHSLDMVGFRTPDETLFLGDCISSAQTLEKYGIVFLFDIEAQLRTLDLVEELESPMFVPSHAEASPDIRELVCLNRSKIYETADKIRDICKEPLTFESILQRIFQRYNLTMTFEQYVLVGSTVRSYLAWLKDKGSITVEPKDNLLLWQHI